MIGAGAHLHSAAGGRRIGVHAADGFREARARPALCGLSFVPAVHDARGNLAGIVGDHLGCLHLHLPGLHLHLLRLHRHLRIGAGNLLHSCRDHPACLFIQRRILCESRNKLQEYPGGSFLLLHRSNHQESSFAAPDNDIGASSVFRRMPQRDFSVLGHLPGTLFRARRSAGPLLILLHGAGRCSSLRRFSSLAHFFADQASVKKIIKGHAGCPG